MHGGEPVHGFAYIISQLSVGESAQAERSHEYKHDGRRVQRRATLKIHRQTTPAAPSSDKNSTRGATCGRRANS